MDKLQKLISKPNQVLILFLCWALFVTDLWLPRNWGFYGNGDWDLTYSTFELARISVLKYSEWPSYQPYLAFGSDLNANPQAVHVSLFFIPVLLFGSFYGYKASILIALLFGLFGSRRLFISIGANHLTAFLMALVFTGAPYFSRHVFEAGHSNFLYVLFLPWLLFHLNSFRINGKKQHAVWSVLLLTQPIAGGAPLVFIFSVFLITLWIAGLMLSKTGNFRTIAAFLLFALLAVLINAWKILPVMDLWKNSPRLVSDDSGINLLVWLNSLMDFKTDTRTAHGWHEFAIGFPAVLLAITIYYFKRLNHYKIWLLMFIPLFWISLGNFPFYFNPWYLFHHYFPFFNSLRAPYRFGGLSLLVFCIAYVRIHHFTKDNSLIYIILIVSALSQTLSFNAISRQLVHGPRIEDIKQEKHSVLEVVNNAASQEKKQYLLLKQEAIIQNAYEPLHLKPVTDSLKSFIEGGQIIKFSPEKITIRSTDSVLKTSLRYSPYWQIKGSGAIGEQNGLLCISGAKGDLELQYINPEFRKGVIISSISLLISILFAFLYRRKS